ncbi:MAG: hypothetical protein WBF53_06600 [Litorimonas sp.]
MSWNPDSRRSGRPGHAPRRHVPRTPPKTERPNTSWDGYPSNGWEEDRWESAWTEPIPRRRRSPVGLFIVLMIAAIFVWEALHVPPSPDARFTLVVEDTIAYAHGGTDHHSFADVRRQLDANPQLETIVLRHVPGTSHLGENTRIAQMIRARGLDTRLERDSFIASGGVDLFLAGETRTMECGARIGVHSWQNQDGDSPRTLGFDPIQERMEAFHASLDVDPRFYAFARDAAPHASLYYLDRDDLAEFDILSDGACEPMRLSDLLPDFLRR